MNGTSLRRTFAEARRGFVNSVPAATPKIAAGYARTARQSAFLRRWMFDDRHGFDGKNPPRARVFGLDRHCALKPSRSSPFRDLCLRAVNVGHAWIDGLCGAIRSGDLPFIPKDVSDLGLGGETPAIRHQRANPRSDTEVQRTDLVEFARRHRHEPYFLKEELGYRRQPNDGGLAMFCKLPTEKGTTVAINPQQVRSVKDAATASNPAAACWINFNSGEHAVKVSLRIDETVRPVEPFAAAVGPRLGGKGREPHINLPRNGRGRRPRSPTRPALGLCWPAPNAAGAARTRSTGLLGATASIQGPP
jgi:hypothetical protein